MNIVTQQGVSALVLSCHAVSARNRMRLMSGMPPILTHLLKPGRVWVSGGCIRSAFDGTPVADIDLFFKDQGCVDEAVRTLQSLGAKPIFICPLHKLRTYQVGTTKLQLITPRFYADAFDLLGSFDFTVCQNAYDGATFTLGLNALRDSRANLLRLHKVEYPVATINRIAKYRSKGYWMPEDEYANLVRIIQVTTFDPQNMALYID